MPLVAQMVSGIGVRRPLLGVFFVTVSLLVFTVRRNTAKMETKQDVDWKSLNLMAVLLPNNLETLRSKVHIEETTVDVLGISVYYKVGSPPVGANVSGSSVLLLHGAAFSSQTWVDRVPTIATLVALGHHVVAVDLPSYGKTKGDVVNKGTFLARLIQSLFGSQRPVVVSPSMSGGFVIPMLKTREYQSLISGWVPVAPVGTSDSSEFFSQLRVPTMLVYGEKDTGLGHRSRDDLAVLPLATPPQVLPSAAHPAYLDQPRLWHTLLANFIAAL